MASLAELQDALVNADKAGDTAAATQLADAIHAMGSVQDAKPVAVKAGGAINQIRRQVGLTARYGMEGLANSAQILTEPIRYFTDKLNPGKSAPLGVMAARAADWMGLPSPQGANERVIGDATRLLAGTAGGIGAGALAQNGAGVVRSVGSMLTTAPASQMASAVGAGLAGGASREAGGGTGGQVVASVLGGLAGAGAVSAGGAVANKARALAATLTPQQMDGRISGVLMRAGVDYSDVPERVRQGLRQDLRSALSADQELDPAAVARLLDFRRNNLTPTRGMVTLDPVQITKEQNLAKIAANSSDGELHGLPRIQNQNNAQLINRMNELGAQSNVDPVTAGRAVVGRVQSTQGALRSAEQGAWDAAKASPGYTQPMYPDALNAINKQLGDDGMMGFMSKPISDYMAAFQTGQQPFTPQAYRNLQSMLAGEMAKGGNEAAAAGIARRVLESSPMRPITNAAGRDFGTAPVTSELAGLLRSHDAQAGQSIDAVNQARQATRAAYSYESSSPLVRSVLADGSDPTRIAKRFVIGGTPDEAAMVAREVGPQGAAVIKDALVNHIKQKALSGAADEVGKVSQSRLNAAIKDIGLEKMRLFFSNDEIQQIQSMGRAASYMGVQPVGSAVNNSNSGALVLGKGVDALRAFANKMPFGQQMIVDPMQNLTISLRQRQAENILPGLLRNQPRVGLLDSMAAPGVAMGGLLSAPRPDN